MSSNKSKISVEEIEIKAARGEDVSAYFTGDFEKMPPIEDELTFKKSSSRVSESQRNKLRGFLEKLNATGWKELPKNSEARGLIHRALKIERQKIRAEKGMEKPKSKRESRIDTMEVLFEFVVFKPNTTWFQAAIRKKDGTFWLTRKLRDDLNFHAFLKFDNEQDLRDAADSIEKSRTQNL